mmetsp:Transcript_36138/g.82362  ORF Transcript_36138/g.82362 Transcript_36138/m.82362 type:complete len:391 (-) Transcript_36138:1723-2895(-)
MRTGWQIIEYAWNPPIWSTSWSNRLSVCAFVTTMAWPVASTAPSRPALGFTTVSTASPIFWKKAIWSLPWVRTRLQAPHMSRPLPRAFTSHAIVAGSRSVCTVCANLCISVSLALDSSSCVCTSSICCWSMRVLCVAPMIAQTERSQASSSGGKKGHGPQGPTTSRQPRSTSPCGVRIGRATAALCPASCGARGSRRAALRAADWDRSWMLCTALLRRMPPTRPRTCMSPRVRSRYMADSASTVRAIFAIRPGRSTGTGSRPFNCCDASAMTEARSSALVARSARYASAINGAAMRAISCAMARCLSVYSTGGSLVPCFLAAEWLTSCTTHRTSSCWSKIGTSRQLCILSTSIISSMQCMSAGWPPLRIQLYMNGFPVSATRPMLDQGAP